MTPFDLILQILDIFPVFYPSVKFDANSFIDDRYMATSRLRIDLAAKCLFGPLLGNFGGFSPPKIVKLLF